jgi:hypothetical protein
MKKTLLSAAAFAVVAVSAVAVAPTTSEAIPAFARQTGAACLSCHFQSFPTLSAFGRSFKYGGFTDVGEQALVEDEGLSIPSVLNATIVVRPQFISTKTTGTGAPVPTATTPSTIKTAAITADNVMLVAGRIGSNTGAFAEIGGGSFANIQLINSFDLGGFKAGVSFFNTSFGSTAGMEVTSVYGQHGGMLNGKNLSAVENTNSVGGNTAGAAIFAANEMGFASLSGVTDGLATGATPNGWKLAPQLRVFLTPEVAGWGLGIGGGITSGKTGNLGTIAALAAALPVGTTSLEMKKWWIDAQAMGEIGDTSIGLFADYASAGASTATTVNLFNPVASKLTGYSIRGTVKPVHNIVVGAGFGAMKQAANGAVAEVKTDRFNVSAEYELYQNMVIALIYESTNVKTTGGTNLKTATTTLDIEALM